MRTPWKFLSDLVSRTASEDRVVERTTKAQDLLAVEHHPAQNGQDVETAVVRQPSNEVESRQSVLESKTVEAASAAGPRSEADIVEQTVNPVATSLPLATEVVTGHVPSISSAQVKDANEDEQSRLVTTATQEVDSSNRPAVAEPAATPLKPASPPEAIVKKSVNEEMVALDEEIAELRRLLAEKLMLQNAYLKSMLDRYTAGT